MFFIYEMRALRALSFHLLNFIKLKAYTHRAWNIIECILWFNELSLRSDKPIYERRSWCNFLCWTYVHLNEYFVWWWWWSCSFWEEYCIWVQLLACGQEAAYRSIWWLPAMDIWKWVQALENYVAEWVHVWVCVLWCALLCCLFSFFAVMFLVWRWWMASEFVLKMLKKRRCHRAICSKLFSNWRNGCLDSRSSSLQSWTDLCHFFEIEVSAPGVVIKITFIEVKLFEKLKCP